MYKIIEYIASERLMSLNKITWNCLKNWSVETTLFTV